MAECVGKNCRDNEHGQTGPDAADLELAAARREAEAHLAQAHDLKKQLVEAWKERDELRAHNEALVFGTCEQAKRIAFELGVSDDLRLSLERARAGLLWVAHHEDYPEEGSVLVSAPTEAEARVAAIGDLSDDVEDIQVSLLTLDLIAAREAHAVKEALEEASRAVLSVVANG